MADQREPNATEMNATMGSEYAKHANSPAATAGGPSVPPEEVHSRAKDVSVSEEAKKQWVGAKGPSEAGKP